MDALTQASIRRMIAHGEEHTARDLYGDAAVDAVFIADGVNPDAVRGD